ncbi:methyltransferase : RNA methyltransferase, RsmD family OS=Singulisphaera acidiphila (strain ATCC BAA-1392 / DSM 18658 / VKM B-2454 / MOB10) GN=Sinac_5937 PE=4 SV=1: Cons_hypoth95 [Gemmataceae bacterium]|nr:methyltransferase : RNA methyltransferase, RsmD family OS=Singulisphaera acidiphila (strain ATCC BAA-1392 / DSM 18658 / VKM B-2454 / MOB10) GN=Sinac_5937 PE=4 SV=1: Cons_hypoth95 [Gemmataceae bacterium]VTU00400.1 methyltransferase : RNA methyltransferase, RsmD family OS=Singulisphaera acidiphila (strain ATCC BAA-1392 / DSM 18658 / VKM B-2454 / MOB10) GN=Sinac_5937 PE=4 SV=1: Cons_hypoth95 [Gemmataceae bacterium]
MLEKTQIRIVAGTLRGRKLTVVVHEGMRPTPQMVREALFSILGNAVPDRVFYDVFAGTGVVGLEAVSRGATGARFIEFDPRQVADIQKYATQFGIGDKVQVLKADVYRWAERWIPPGKDAVNLFLSPPFPDLSQKAAEFLKLMHTLLEKAPDESVLTIQAEEGFPLEQLPDRGAWDVRSYGRNMLLFYVVSRKPVVAAAATPEA